MNDKEKDVNGQKKSVKKSRGLRGSQEIAKACRHALQSCESGRIRELENGRSFVFDACAISRRDRAFWEENSDADTVLRQAQDRARELSSAPWTPLIPVETGLSDEVEAHRIADIEEAKRRATDLSRVLLQK